MKAAGILALGIDVGTSGIRTSVLNGKGVEHGGSDAAFDEFGSDFRDPAVWHQALGAALRKLAGAVDLQRIGAVAVDGTSGTVLGLDQHDLPVGTALMYNDVVNDPTIAAAIDKVAPANSPARGGGSALARAIALQERPAVRRIVHQADWIAGLLASSPPPSDESNALKTGYDPMARCWPSWIKETPLRQGLLPDVIACGAYSGKLSGAFGLPKGAMLVAGMSDGCASFMATGANQPGDAVTALGTTLTVKLLSERPIMAPEFGIYSHRIGDMWLAGGASNTGGGALAVHFSSDAVERLSEEIDPKSNSGLDYYPLPKPGERFPVADPKLQPRTTPRPKDDALFLHGLLEGIARIEATGYRRLKDLGATPARTLRTVGGGARNATWTAMRSRISALPIADSASDAAAAGVARLAIPTLKNLT